MKTLESTTGASRGKQKSRARIRKGQTLDYICHIAYVLSHPKHLSESTRILQDNQNAGYTVDLVYNTRSMEGELHNAPLAIVDLNHRQRVRLFAYEDSLRFRQYYFTLVIFTLPIIFQYSISAPATILALRSSSSG